MFTLSLTTTIGVAVAMWIILLYYPRYAYQGAHRAIPTISALQIPVRESGAKRRWDGKADRREFNLSDRPNKHSVAYLGKR